jgi:hypothetical protein
LVVVAFAVRVALARDRDRLLDDPRGVDAGWSPPVSSSCSAVV